MVSRLYQTPSPSLLSSHSLPPSRCLSGPSRSPECFFSYTFVFPYIFTVSIVCLFPLSSPHLAHILLLLSFIHFLHSLSFTSLLEKLPQFSSFQVSLSFCLSVLRYLSLSSPHERQKDKIKILTSSEYSALLIHTWSPDAVCGKTLPNPSLSGYLETIRESAVMLLRMQTSSSR